MIIDEVSTSKSTPKQKNTKIINNDEKTKKIIEDNHEEKTIKKMS